MRMDHHRGSALAIALAVLAVIAGCTGGAGGAVGPDRGGVGGGVGEFDGQSDGPEAEATLGAAGSIEEGARAAAGERARIRTGRMTIAVDSFEGSRGNVTAATEAYGGFVSDSYERRHGTDNETYTTGQLTLRVPAENFTALMDRLASVGTVEERSTNSQDVTEQLVDIEARLDNLRAERDRLRELYTTANDTQSVLAVERRLSEVQTEIERLEARQQSLERQVALSTITVELREAPPEPEPTEKWYDVGLVKAFLDSIDGVWVTLRALSVAFAYALPYLVVFGLPLSALAIAILRWRGRLPKGGL